MPLYLPIWDVVCLFLFPGTRHVAKRSLVEDVGDRLIDTPPDFSKWIGDFRIARMTLHILDCPQHFADGDRIGRFSKQIASFGAAPGVDKSALLQAGQNEFEELL